MVIGSLISQKSILICFFCLASIACDKGKEVSEYKVKEKIDHYWPRLVASDSLELAQFDVCQLLPGSGWDRAYVVHPYMTLDQLRKLDLNNFSSVEDEFRHFRSSDFQEGFLFVKNQDIVSYSISNRRLNFDNVSSFTKEECQNLLIKRYAPDGTAYFHVALK